MPPLILFLVLGSVVDQYYNPAFLLMENKTLLPTSWTAHKHNWQCWCTWSCQTSVVDWFLMVYKYYIQPKQQMMKKVYYFGFHGWQFNMVDFSYPIIEFSYIVSKIISLFLIHPFWWVIFYSYKGAGFFQISFLPILSWKIIPWWYIVKIILVVFVSIFVKSHADVVKDFLQSILHKICSWISFA